MEKSNIWRSLLFVPANNWKMLGKATTENEDCVIIDLEDSCPYEELDRGRKYAADISPIMKDKGIDVLVRVNALTTGVTSKDIGCILNENIDGIMLPKTENAEDIQSIVNMIKNAAKEKGLRKTTKIVPLIESPKGIFNLSSISTSSDEISALCFGAMDYMRELGDGFAATKLSSDDYFSVLLYARSLMATTAHACGIPAIDTPFLGSIKDVAGLQDESKKVKMVGFKGKMVIHPIQIDPVNAIFAPSIEDVKLSEEMVQAYITAKNQGKGAAVMDGKMIDAAMYKAGIELISKAEAISQKSKNQKT